VRAWRAICPELTIRSTFIAGFPGETAAEFEALLAFLREAQLDRVGCFAYSPVDGASANALPDPVPEEVREERRGRFMRLQQEISTQRLAARVGTVQRVLVDAAGPAGAVARTRGDAPEIDGVVHIAADPALAVGQFCDVRIIASDAHDLTGVVA
jgi:ribosomal protein S12 methylthiotransferase